MICKSCGSRENILKNLCDKCLSDYRYNQYRKSLLRSQELSNRPLSREGGRWNKKQVKLIKARLEEYITRLYSNGKTFTRREIQEDSGASEGIVHYVLNKMMSEGKLERSTFHKNYVIYHVITQRYEDAT